MAKSFYSLLKTDGDYLLKTDDGKLQLNEYYFWEPLVAELGSFALTGQIVNLFKGKIIQLATGIYNLTGGNLITNWIQHFIMGLGSYVLTGQDTLFHRGYKILMSVGSYVLTGFDTLFKKVKNVSMALGTYVLTGQNAIFRRVCGIVMVYGSYILTGQAILFKKVFRVITSFSSYIITMLPFKTSGHGDWLWTKQNKSTDSGWTKTPKN